MNTDTTKRYRLRKDLPDAKAGTDLYWDAKGFYSIMYNNNYLPYRWSKEKVESIKEWFEEVLQVSEPVKERIKVGKMSCNEIVSTVYGDLKWALQFRTNKHIHYDKAIELCNLIERYLNGEMDNPLPSSLNSNDTGKQFIRESKPMEEKDVVCPPQKNISFTEQPTNDNAFWSDERVCDFLFVNNNDNEHKKLTVWDSLQKFKQSKQSTPVGGKEFIAPASLAEHPQCKPAEPLPTKQDKDWEIVTCYHGDSNIIHDYIPKGNPERSNSCDDEGCKIHSVKRLSDNTIWTVGDKVEYGAISMDIAAQMKLKETTIASFKINEGNIWAYGDNFFIAPLNHLRNPTTPSKPIEEDKPVTISSNNDDVACLSLNDLLDVWDIDGLPFAREYYKTSKLFKNFEQKAKQKLKQ